MFCSFIKKYLFSFFSSDIYLAWLCQAHACIQGWIWITVIFLFQLLYISLLISCVLNAVHVLTYTHTKKWMLWNCKKWWVWIYLGYSTTGKCRKSFKTTWIRKSDRTKCNRASYFQWWQPWGEWTLITYIQM